MTQAGAAPIPSPQAAPAPSPNYVPPIPPAAPAAAPASMEAGGSTPSNYAGNFKAFFQGINWLDVALSSFVVAAMAYSIKYHKYMLLIEKSGYTNLSERVNGLETKMAKKISEMNASGSRGRKRGVVRL